MRVTEIFSSLQGEGLRVGSPSVFLRLFGCNLQCDKFGQTESNEAPDRHQINPDLYQTIDELPLAKIGCDSYASWDPRFKKFSEITPVSKIADILKNARPAATRDLVITGGEPLLWQSALLDLIPELGSSFRHITFETNGTQKLSEEFIDGLNNWTGTYPVFSISPKLESASGEPSSKTRKCTLEESGILRCADKAYLKFVCNQKTTADEINDYIDFYAKKYLPYKNDFLPVYLMPVGGTSDVYQKNSQHTVELCYQTGYRYSPRLHIDLFGNRWGT